ncbi:MAG: CotH kinase family protein [Campylobacterota bacterium]|nr:CotH kinase family protein [Campylobacterota bacterium]
MLKSFILYISIFVIFSACSSYNDIKQSPSFEGNIADTKTWYDDVNYDIKTINVSIPIPNSLECEPPPPYQIQADALYDLSLESEYGLAPKRPCSLEDIVQDINGYDSYQPELSVLMSSDDFTTVTENTVMKLRGDYSRKSTTGDGSLEANAKVKSYSLKLSSDTNLLWNQRKLQLSKYKSDTTRVKNRLAFELMRDIPNITSVKMQFVNLFVNDVDYGLYTNAEAIRAEYLVNRGWNKDDKLYNAGNCMFEPLDELRVDSKGVPLDEEAFGTILEIRTGDDHSNVMKVMEAIHSDTPIDMVIEKHFNRENYITWLAINLVLSNKDTTYHNFYLYNPLYSEKFYFIPWDYDGAWATKNYLGKNEYGISVWWKTMLHKKFMSVPKNLQDIYNKAEYIRQNYITDEKVKEKLALFEKSVMEFSIKEPDSLFTSSSDWNSTTYRLVTGIENNMDLYKDVIGHPMPFWQAVKYEDNRLIILWGKSVDLEGDEIVYDIRISKDINFLSEEEDIFSDYEIEEGSADKMFSYADISLDLNSKYYLKVISREKDDPTHYQISLTQARDENNENTIDAPSSTRFGILEFEIDADGNLNFEDESDLLYEEE